MFFIMYMNVFEDGTHCTSNLFNILLYTSHGYDIIILSIACTYIIFELDLLINFFENMQNTFY